MHSAAAHDQEPYEHRAQTRPEAGIVVSCSFPLRKAVSEEVVVSFARRALEDLGNDGETLVVGRGLFEVGVTLLLGWGLVDLDTTFLLLHGMLGFEVAEGLVRVDLAGLFAVGFGQFVLGCGGLDAEEVVKGDIGAVVGDDLVVKAEDFVV